jgi:flagellar protein FliJ
MSALNSLVRVHNWALDEKRQKLAELDRLADKLRSDLVLLEQELVQEQSAAARSVEGSIAFPAFIAAALERRKRLRESIANIELAC